MPAPNTRTDKIDLRISPAAKKTLRAAAEASHKTLSEFVIDSAMARAGELLADKTRFVLQPDAWEAFMEALDAPPSTHPRLERLLSEPSVFEKP